MIRKNLKLLKNEFDTIKVNSKYGTFLRNGISLSKNGQCILLTQSKYRFKFSVYENHSDYEVWIGFENKLEMKCDCNNELVCSHKISSLLQSIEILERESRLGEVKGYRYTRSGMIDRVLKERWQKALTAKYEVSFSDNKFGEHSLFNEYGKEYKITVRDFHKEIGYCSCPDYRTNKLGTCKHLMYVFNNVKQNPILIEEKDDQYPFVEIYLNPRSNYRISWFHKGRIESPEISELIYSYFGNSTFLSDEKLIHFLGFLHDAAKYENLKVRPEVFEKVEKVYNVNMLNQIRTSVSLDFGIFKDDLEDLQREKLEFITFNENVVIADEFDYDSRKMTIMSFILKKEVIGLENCLILCQESMTKEWSAIIDKYISGNTSIASSFNILNYESLVEKDAINIPVYDVLVLDEASHIRKYKNKPADFINKIRRKHNIVLSSSNLYDNLSDLYSVVGFADQSILSPLWEFSFNHYYFDEQSKNKITGYYNLKELYNKLSSIVLSGPQLNESMQRKDSDNKTIQELDEIISEQTNENKAYKVRDKGEIKSKLSIIEDGIGLLSKSLKSFNIGEILESERVVEINDETGEVTIKFKIQKVK